MGTLLDDIKYEIWGPPAAEPDPANVVRSEPKVLEAANMLGFDSLDALFERHGYPPAGAGNAGQHNNAVASLLLEIAERITALESK